MPRSKPHRRPFFIIRYTCGVLLLPLAAAGTLALVNRLRLYQFGDYAQLAFLTGGGVYIIMHLLLWKPIFMHVMGHELTHAFWAFILGGRIKSFQVSSAGGQVTLSKSNFLIALAPYFFPFYTFLLFPVYFICIPKFQPVLALLLGFTLAFHYALTLHSLQDHQSDLHETGLFFSLSFVYLMNLVVLVLVLSVIAPQMFTPVNFALETWHNLVKFWFWLLGFFR
jgi:hypothetical protein